MLEDAVRRTYSFACRHRPAVQLLMRTVLDTGALQAEHREAVQLPFLERGAPLLAALLGQPVQQVRLTMLSITYLVVRFALNTPEEQARITAAPGANTEGTDDPDRAVADHLVAAAQALLFINTNTNTNSH